MATAKRDPTIGNNALVGAPALVLGAITINETCAPGRYRTTLLVVSIILVVSCCAASMTRLPSAAL